MAVDRFDTGGFDKKDSSVVLEGFGDFLDALGSPRNRIACKFPQYGAGGSFFQSHSDAPKDDLKLIKIPCDA